MSTKERQQSPGEEVANSVSHGLALLAAIAAVPFMIATALRTGIMELVAAAVFALAMVLLYLCSTLYHALPAGRAKHLVLKLDHGAIYLFIAASYTAFALRAAMGSAGLAVLALVWLLALGGAALKVSDRLSHPWLSTGLYLAMGWFVLIAAVPLVAQLSAAELDLLLAGGVAYSAGVVFFMLDTRLRYAHAVWHCFVVAGSGCHFFAVLDCLAR